jgi:4'-phosphopantetheinyl transferase EntD
MSSAALPIPALTARRRSRTPLTAPGSASTWRQQGRVGDVLAPAVCSRSELAALDKCRSGGRGELLTLIFSAKESVFKAVFPRQRLFLEFNDVRIDFEPENGSFRAHGRAPELQRLLDRLEGRFAVGKVNLATTAVLSH